MINFLIQISELDSISLDAKSFSMIMKQIRMKNCGKDKKRKLQDSNNSLKKYQDIFYNLFDDELQI